MPLPTSTLHAPRFWTAGAIEINIGDSRDSHVFEFRRPHWHRLTVEDCRVLLSFPELLRQRKTFGLDASWLTRSPAGCFEELARDLLERLLNPPDIFWLLNQIPTLSCRLDYVGLSLDHWADSFGYHFIPEQARAEVQHFHSLSGGHSQTLPVPKDEEGTFVLDQNMILHFGI